MPFDWSNHVSEKISTSFNLEARNISFNQIQSTIPPLHVESFEKKDSISLGIKICDVWKKFLQCSHRFSFRHICFDRSRAREHFVSKLQCGMSSQSNGSNAHCANLEWNDRQPIGSRFRIFLPRFPSITQYIPSLSSDHRWLILIFVSQNCPLYVTYHIQIFQDVQFDGMGNFLSESKQTGLIRLVDARRFIRKPKSD